MHLTLWHNPRCSKSREALALLRANGVEPELFEYLRMAPSEAQIRVLLRQLAVDARDLVRTGDDPWRQAGLNEASDEAQLVAAMAAYPALIQRPIAVAGERAVIGRPPERVLSLLAP